MRNIDLSIRAQEVEHTQPNTDASGIHIYLSAENRVMLTAFVAHTAEKEAVLDTLRAMLDSLLFRGEY